VARIRALCGRIIFGVPIISVSIAPPHLHRGRYRPAHNLGREIMVTLCLAGIAAEELFCGPITDPAAIQQDLRIARAHLSRAIADPLQVIAELLRCRDAAARLVRSQWGATRIAKLAEALLRQGTLRGEQIFAFC
jgi:hypothetical protein